MISNLILAVAYLCFRSTGSNCRCQDVWKRFWRQGNWREECYRRMDQLLWIHLHQLFWWRWISWYPYILSFINTRLSLYQPEWIFVLQHWKWTRLLQQVIFWFRVSFNSIPNHDLAVARAAPSPRVASPTPPTTTTTRATLAPSITESFRVLRPLSEARMHVFVLNTCSSNYRIGSMQGSDVG